MHISWNHPAVRLTGRWSRPESGPAVTTATGAYFELAFRGDMALLHFDMTYCFEPAPHLWMQLDGGAMIEAPLAHHLRVKADGKGEHLLRVIYKSGIEGYHRWYAPLSAKVAFIGAEAEAPGPLPADDRPVIEFVGDSITEGVLTDADYAASPAYQPDVLNRVYQNDVCATYAWLTAQALNMRPSMMGYGAVGATKGGSGNVPRAALAYPYAFDGCPFEGDRPAIVVINHGANDRAASPDAYIQAYSELVELIQSRQPQASICCLGAFCGAFARELDVFVKDYNAVHAKPILFIDSTGWVPLEPLHPLRAGHALIAQNTAAILAEYIKRQKCD